jgi:hypothetical protein
MTELIVQLKSSKLDWLVSINATYCPSKFTYLLQTLEA